MNAKHQKRLWTSLFVVVGLSVSMALILYAFSNHIDLYYSPTEFQDLPSPHDKTIRVGGMVVKNSVQRGAGCFVSFDITDFESTLTVHYAGILPDLFREGQGVVMLGHKLDNQVFEAKQVLAKHDENYMPPEVAKHQKQVNRAT